MLGRTRTRRLAALALVAGLALSGCGPAADPGAAAQVGDEVISVSYVQRQFEQILDQSGQGASMLTNAQLADNQRGLLGQLIEDSLIVHTADRLGVSVSQAQVDQVKTEIRNQRVFVPPDMLDGFARWVALRRALNTHLLGRTPTTQQQQAEADRRVQEEIAKTAREVGVRVNPRYGEWNGARLVPGGQLVTPSPEESLPAFPMPAP